jgi:uncharacterized membrane protein/protein-disulfide isomerase
MPEKKSNLMRKTLLLIFSTTGFFISLYSIILYAKLKINPDALLRCDLSKTFSCSSSLKGPYSDLLGMPNGFLGLIYFSFYWFLGLSQKWFKLNWSERLHYQITLSSVGILGSLTFTLLLKWGVQSFCPICLATHVVNLFLFVFTLTLWLKEKKKSQASFYLPHLTSLFFGSIIFATPFLFGGWLFNPLLKTFASKQQEESTEHFSKEDWNKRLYPLPASDLALLKIEKNPLDTVNFDLIKGPSNPLFSIIIYSDFSCPACQSLLKNLLPLSKELSEHPIQWVYRHLPFDQDCNPLIQYAYHEFSCEVSRISLCAQQQKNFWEILDPLKQEIQKANFLLKSEDISHLKKFLIQKMGIEEDLLNQCLDTKMFEEKLSRDIHLGNRLNQKKIPVLIINGKVYDGNFSLAQLKGAILHELSEISSDLP